MPDPIISQQVPAAHVTEARSGHDLILATSGGTPVRATAQILYPNVERPLGPNRLWVYLREIGWAEKTKATPLAVEAGFALPGRPMLITGKGMIELWRLLGGFQEIESGEYDPRDNCPICSTCGGDMQYLDCPTGGWWVHDEHPADGHDAVLGEDPHGYVDEDGRWVFGATQGGAS